MKKTKSIVIGSEKNCFFCMRHADGEHHLIFGNSARKLADEDGLKIPVIIWVTGQKGYMTIPWQKGCLKCWDRQYMN